MKIRAAIANMTVDSNAPMFGGENIIVRRRLSSEEAVKFKSTGKLFIEILALIQS
jgi:hypothetical protein